MRVHLKRPSPGVVLGTLALFVSLGQVGYSATGGAFVLGSANSASKQSSLTASAPKNTLQVTNRSKKAGSTALGLTVAAGHAPFSTNGTGKVTNLNADRLDGFDSTAFLRAGTAKSLGTSGGIVDVTNTGDGFGVAGRSNEDFGVGLLGEALGHGGLAGKFLGNIELQGNLFCTGCVGAAAIGQKVNDSEKLDGLDSTGFVQGTGRAEGRTAELPAGLFSAVGTPLFGVLQFRYSCPATPNVGDLEFVNLTGGLLNAFWESGQTNPTFVAVSNGNGFDLAAEPAGDSFRLHLQGAFGIATVDIATRQGPAGTCHVQLQGLLTS